jgi:hypothetical protein
MIKKLFENFRNYLSEDLDDLNSLALLIDVKGKEHAFILYDPSMIKSEADLQEKSMVDRVILAVVRTDKISSTFGKCYDAREVTRSATNELAKGKRFGFLLYQIAMVYDNKPITGDRSGTSDSAKRVYDALPAISKPFDDIESPQTPPKKDDCYLDTDTVNKAYWIDDGKKQEISNNISTLTANHDISVQKINNELNIDKAKLESALLRNSVGLFLQQYHKRK